jgi:hypothetical protein
MASDIQQLANLLDTPRPRSAALLIYLRDLDARLARGELTHDQRADLAPRLRHRLIEHTLRNQKAKDLIALAEKLLTPAAIWGAITFLWQRNYWLAVAPLLALISVVLLFWLQRWDPWLNRWDVILRHMEDIVSRLDPRPR